MARHSIEKIKRDLRWLLSLVVVASAVLSSVPYLDPYSHYLDLASQFRVQYLLVGVLGGVTFLVLKKYLWVLLSLLCVAINLFELSSVYYVDRNLDEDSLASIRVMLANIGPRNENYSEFLEIVNEEKPDILAVVEVRKNWTKTLEALEEKYPFNITKARSDNIGIVLYSSRPLSNAKEEYFIKDGPPSLTATLEINGNSVKIIATHLPPPIFSSYFRLRNELLATIGSSISINDPIVMLGDLNMTMWSAHYRLFEQHSGLTNARYGAGMIPTWPVQIPFLFIPIDHIMFSPHFFPENTRTRYIPGSDHFALLSDLHIRK